MMTSSMILTATQTDSDLVGETLSGNRDAFGQIVSRYQSLICSLAYSATGSLGQSEDLAQETFITAWKRLAHLRERDKLRAWLCGIARNRINNFLRREGREPVRQAEPLDEIFENHSPEPLPVEHAISKEEEQILWRSLERIPEIYREPLILFYREQQSIETVAANLDLSENAVKQRLSRGRKLLQEQVLAFVEGALARTNPGKVFTISVLAALPVTLTTSAKAATIGAAAKGTLFAKITAAGILSMVFNVLPMFFGFYASYRASLAEARSEIERRHIKKNYRNSLAVALALFVTFAGTTIWFCRNQPNHSLLVTLLFVGAILIYLGTFLVFTAGMSWTRRKFLTGILAQNNSEAFTRPAWEFRSRASFLGLPLVHVRLGDRFAVLKKPIVAWIAVGERSIGGLFAFGGIAIAPVSIGGIAAGLLPFGGVALGILALGGFTLGVWTFGGLVLGWQAFGGCAIAWHAANGGIALARDFAVGDIARAAQANTDAARQFIDSNLFFHWIHIVNSHWFWMNLLWITPVLISWRLTARKSKTAAAQNFREN